MSHKTSPIWKPDPETFAEVVKNSSTFTEILQNFGLENKGANHKTLKTRISEEELDVSHIYLHTNQQKTKAVVSLNKGKKISLQLIMVEDTSYDTTKLKRRIIDECIIPYQCEECWHKGEWNGKPLSLHLDHKNGNRRDARRENLRFLCPNCHSQTDTYCGKSKKPLPLMVVHKCVSCHAAQVSAEGRQCVRCRAKKQRKVTRPSQEELAALIISMPFTRIAERYGVSDQAIRNWCKTYGLPHRTKDLVNRNYVRLTPKYSTRLWGPSNSKSGYKGVTYASNGSRKKRWQARVHEDRKYKSLGYYDTPVKAARVYDEYIEKHYPEAPTNNQLGLLEEATTFVVGQHRGLPSKQALRLLGECPSTPHQLEHATSNPRSGR